MLSRLFNKPKLALVKETSGRVRITLIVPGDSSVELQTREFPYRYSVAIMHPDDESNWFLIILDEGQDDAYTFGVHQDRVFTVELIEGAYAASDY